MENENAVINCQCGNQFNFEDGVKRHWRDGFMILDVVCPECQTKEYVCKLGQNTVEKRRIMIRRAKTYRETPLPQNKRKYLLAVQKYQLAFDRDNGR